MKTPQPLKRFLPATLFGRSLLIIVLPVAIMQIAVTWVFFDAHWTTVNSRLSEGLAGDIAWAVESLRDDPSPEAVAVLSKRAEESLSLSIVLQPGRSLPVGRRPSLFASLDRSLNTALSERLDAPFWFDTTRYPAFVDIRVATPSRLNRSIHQARSCSASRSSMAAFSASRFLLRAGLSAKRGSVIHSGAPSVVQKRSQILLPKTAMFIQPSRAL